MFAGNLDRMISQLATRCAEKTGSAPFLWKSASIVIIMAMP